MLKGLLPENAAEFYDTIDMIILILSLVRKNLDD